MSTKPLSSGMYWTQAAEYWLGDADGKFQREMLDSLSLCPGCGNEVYFYTENTSLPNKWKIRCDHCALEMGDVGGNPLVPNTSNYHRESVQRIVKRWNELALESINEMDEWEDEDMEDFLSEQDEIEGGVMQKHGFFDRDEMEEAG